MMKYEHRAMYDSFGTDNYTVDKENSFSKEITEEQAKQFVEFWTAIGCKHYETSKAHVYEKQHDARHITAFVLYK